MFAAVDPDEVESTPEDVRMLVEVAGLVVDEKVETSIETTADF